MKTDSLHPIEQLLTKKSQQSDDNWLLPYLDVFILLTMMFIVLLSMSSFELTDTKVKVNQQQVALDKLREEIEPLRQLEMDGRSALVMEHWQERIHQVLDSLKLRDDIALSLDDEFISLEINDQMLFDSGRANLKTDGAAILNKLIPVLSLSAGTIHIEGHTDNMPIDTNQFPSNWELGAARASSVLRYLSSQGMDANRLRATSYADTKPIADNATEQGRQQNRRVTLLLRMPNLD
ncbi:MAG: OmpA family protein [Kangiellaceae bacterium]|jgi:chemotaxis protein MotB|nr:OmpA family protein [Kangiellaceae bacterium]